MSTADFLHHVSYTVDNRTDKGVL